MRLRATRLSAIGSASLRLGSVPILDQLSAASAAAYSLRRTRTAHTGGAIRNRRSSDNAELDIGFATAVQTRTNLAAIPINNNSGLTAPGVTMTTIGTGTEFGQPYIDVRWQGTASAAGFLQFAHSVGGAFNPTIHAPVTPGLTHSTSIGFRLVSGTAPSGPLFIRGEQFNNTGGFIGGTGTILGQSTSTLQRGAVIEVAAATAAYIRPNIFMSVNNGEVVNVTIRFYAANVEQGIGNARPLLQRNVPETVAAIGELDAEALLTFVGGGSGFVTTWYDQSGSPDNLVARSQELENNYWKSDAAAPTFVINSAVAPDGTTTAEKMIETATLSPHNRYVILSSQPAGTYTWSIFAKAAERNLLRVSLGTAGIAFGVDAYFNLATGTIASGPNAFGGATNTQATITDAGNGWYRCSVTVTMNAGQIIPGVWIRDAATGASYTGVAGNGLLIWGAQLNTGSVAQPYQVTTASAIVDRNATQTTAGSQPRIVNNGAIETLNGRATVVQTATDQSLPISGGFTGITSATGVFVFRQITGSGGAHDFRASDEFYIHSPYIDGNAYDGFFSSSRQMFANYGPAGVDAPTNTLTTHTVRQTGTALQLFKNGTQIDGDKTVPFTTYGTGEAFLMNNAGSNGTVALSEGIVFGTALSTTDRQTLEGNQGAYYGITVT